MPFLVTIVHGQNPYSNKYLIIINKLNDKQLIFSPTLNSNTDWLGIFLESIIVAPLSFMVDSSSRKVDIETVHNNISNY